MNLLKEIKENHLIGLFLDGTFGLEKEGLRVKLPADLATTIHPASLGNREINPYIQTDYAEAMPELITPPLSPYSKAHSYLELLNYILLTNLAEDEYMWPFSVPCRTSENEDKIQISQTNNQHLNNYRIYTAAKYGKKRQLINGIHINYSFNDTFLSKLFEVQNTLEETEELRDELYLKLTSNFLRYQWLIVYLFGASPVAEDNFYASPFFAGKTLPTRPMRSLRNSQYGFINRPEIRVRYDSIQNYTSDLNQAVSEKLLAEEREFYGDIRLRGLTKNSKSLLKDGIQYIEIRSFDNNPYHTSGIDIETLQFIHLFFLTMVTISTKASPVDTVRGRKLKKIVAEEYPLVETVQYKEGLWLLSEMQRVINELELEPIYTNLINQARVQLEHPEKTISGKIVQHLKADTTLLALGQELGWKHKKETLASNGLPWSNHLSLEQREKLFTTFLKG